MAEPLVTTEWDGKLAVIAMQRAPHNLLNAGLMTGLVEAIQGAERDGARAILIRSKLKHFSAGADLSLFEPGDGAGVGGGVKGAGPMAFLDTFENCALPIVAAVHGAALGGGLEVALACDLIVVARSARLGAVETTIGLAPLMGCVPRLVARVGPAKAKEIAMFGRRYDAETFERMGVVNLVVDDDDLDRASRSYAKQLAVGPTIAIGAIKKIANAAIREGTTAGDVKQGDALGPVMSSKDMRRGIKAFATTGAGASAPFEGN